MIKVLLTARKVCFVLSAAILFSLPACHTTKPDSNVVSPAPIGAPTPTPTPAPSIWSNVGSNLAKFNSQVGKAWNSDQVQSAIKAAGPVAAQALTDYVNNGGKLTSQDSAALVVQGATAIAPSITTNKQLQNVIVQAAVQGAADPKFKTPAMDIARAVTKGLSATPTPVESAQAISAAGVLMSTAPASSTGA